MEIGDHAFSRCTGLTKITFTGDAPAIGENAFSQVVATVYYPADNVTWTDEAKQNYGGTLTWTIHTAPAGSRQGQKLSVENPGNQC